MPSHGEAMGTYRLGLNYGFVLDLGKTFYILLFSGILIFVSRLLPLAFTFNLIWISFYLYKDSIVISNGILDDSLFKL